MKNNVLIPIFDRRLSLLMALAVASALCLSVPGITFAHQLNMNFEGDYEFPRLPDPGINPPPPDAGINPTFHYLQLRTTVYFLAEGVDIPWLSNTKALPTSKNPNDPVWLGTEPEEGEEEPAGLILFINESVNNFSTWCINDSFFSEEQCNTAEPDIRTVAEEVAQGLYDINKGLVESMPIAWNVDLLPNHYNFWTDLFNQYPIKVVYTHRNHQRLLLSEGVETIDGWVYGWDRDPEWIEDPNSPYPTKYKDEIMPYVDSTINRQGNFGHFIPAWNPIPGLTAIRREGVVFAGTSAWLNNRNTIHSYSGYAANGQFDAAIGFNVGAAVFEELLAIGLSYAVEWQGDIVGNKVVE